MKMAHRLLKKLKKKVTEKFSMESVLAQMGGLDIVTMMLPMEIHIRMKFRIFLGTDKKYHITVMDFEPLEYEEKKKE